MKKSLKEASLAFFIFSRDEATLYERVSVRWLVGWLIGSLRFRFSAY